MKKRCVAEMRLFSSNKNKTLQVMAEKDTLTHFKITLCQYKGESFFKMTLENQKVWERCDNNGTDIFLLWILISIDIICSSLQCLRLLWQWWWWFLNKLECKDIATFTIVRHLFQHELCFLLSSLLLRFVSDDHYSDPRDMLDNLKMYLHVFVSFGFTYDNNVAMAVYVLSVIKTPFFFRF